MGTIYSIPSRTKPGEWYEVERQPWGWSCTCPHGRKATSGSCWHKRQAIAWEREEQAAAAARAGRG